MKVIDLEAHFYTQSYLAHLRSRKGVPREECVSGVDRCWYADQVWVPRKAEIQAKVLDVGRGRIKDMDDAGIAIQVLSLNAPHIQLFEPGEGVTWARRINDELSAIVKQYPDRYVGLASIAPQSPAEAADELERAVVELGLKGLLIQSHARNEHLDDKKYWGIFERAEKLDVPIYLHPMIPVTSMLEPYAGYGGAFVDAPFGFAAETSLHVIRLIHSGLFDRYPGLKMVLGHMGEGLPYWLSRMDVRWVNTKKPSMERKPSDYIKTNFTITISGMFFQPAFMCAYLALGADKIAFAVDYPAASSAEAMRFMREAPICDTDKEKIYHLNAERLLKL